MNDTEQDTQERREEVRRMLAGGDSPQPEVPLDLDPEITARLARQQELAEQRAENEIPPPEDPEDAVQADPPPGQPGESPPDPDRGRESDLFGDRPNEETVRKASLGYTQLAPKLEDEHLEPTDEDKSIYLKAVMHDEPVQFAVTLPGIGVKAVVRSLNNYEQDLVFVALRRGLQDKTVEGPAQYMTYMQRFSMALQLVRFGEKEMAPPSFEPGGLQMPAVEALEKRVDEVIAPISWATWNGMLTALSIFEGKLTACNRASLDKNFWTPADTA